MKIFFLLVIILSALFISCNEETIVEPKKQVVEDIKTTMNLTIDNQYYFHYVHGHGSVFFDWYETKTILRDTILNENKYFIFSDGVIIRTSSNSVLQWNGSSEKILYNYDVKVGDTIIYEGNQLKITDIITDSVFSDTQKIFEASNSGLTTDTTFTIKYATKFGLLRFSKSIGNGFVSYSLLGAIIDSTTYGSF